MKLKAIIALLCSMSIMHHVSICMESNLNTIDCSLMLLSQTYGFIDHVVDLSKTTDVSAQDKVGKTRLHYAVALQDVASVQALLKEPTEKSLVALQDIEGNTPLHHFFYHTVSYYQRKPLFDIAKALEILTLLLGASIDPTLKNKKGDTVVHCAVKTYNELLLKRQERLLRMFVAHGIPLDVTNNEGETPLHCVFSSTANTQLCAMLLELGASPEARNCLGETPLHYAAIYPDYQDTNYAGRIAAIKLLCAKGNPNCLTDNLETPLHYVFKCHDYNASTHLLEQRLVLASTFLELGANPNAQNQFGVSPLYALISSPWTEEKQSVARDILTKYAGDPNIKTKAGFTCLHSAVCGLQVPWVRLLLEHKPTDIAMVHEPMLKRAPTLAENGKTALAFALEMQQKQREIVAQPQENTQQPKRIVRTQAAVQLNKNRQHTTKIEDQAIDDIVKLFEKHQEQPDKN